MIRFRTQLAPAKQVLLRERNTDCQRKIESSYCSQSRKFLFWFLVCSVRR